MQESGQFSHKCYFCYGNDQQKSFLLRSLYRRFKRQLRFVQNHPLSKLLKYQGNNFKQMIKIIFPSLLRENDQCEHESYAISFCNNLQIDQQLFGYLCQRLSNSIGQTNYQLSLILAQIKNVGDSLADRRINHHDYQDDSQQSSISIKKRNHRRSKKKVRDGSMKPVVQKQQQVVINSSQLNGGINLIPLMHSQISISSHSEQNVNHISYYFSYPIFFQTNDGLQ